MEVLEGQIWSNKKKKYIIDQIAEEDMGSFSCWVYELDDIDKNDCFLISIKTWTNEWTLIKD